MLSAWLVPVAEPSNESLAWLSRAERQRFAGISHPMRARAFATARLVLKLGLARLTDTAPDAWTFAAEGAPLVQGPEPDWRVSIAHSGGWVLCAAHQGDAVGCDIEQRKPRRNLLALAEQYFSIEEQQALAEVSGEAQLDHFYRMWTAKEAYLKALQRGIANGLTRFRLLPAQGLAHCESGAWALHSAHWHDCQLSFCLPADVASPFSCQPGELQGCELRCAGVLPLETLYATAPGF